MTYREAVNRLTDGTPGVPWAVTTSANVALRGIDIEPSDKNLIRTANGTYVAEVASFSDIIRPVRLPQETNGERTRSHFGALKLAGTKVEPIGDVIHRVDDAWNSVADVANTSESLSVEGRKVPATSPSSELPGYRELGREERVCPSERARVKA